MTHRLNLAMRKFVAPEFVFGQGASGLVGQYALNHGANRVFVVTDSVVREQAWYAGVIDSLDRSKLGHDEFFGISPNPRALEVMEGTTAYDASNCDLLVAIGGGSVMDCAKGIAIASANNQPITGFEGVDKIPQPGPPLICIPTTSGSAADVSQFAIINDSTRRVKIAIVSKLLVPDVSLLDPDLTVTMDRDLTVHTGLDALTHAFEAYTSKARSPVTDVHALEAVKRVVGFLGIARDHPEDIEARGEVMLGSLFAGLAFSNAILGNVHAMAHSLGGFLDLPHGLCNAVLLDYVVDYNFDVLPGRYVELAAAMGAEGVRPDRPAAEQKDAVVRSIRKLKADLGVCSCLKEIGVSPKDIPELAAKAVQDACALTNPKETSLDGMTAIFQAALEGHD
ncbi:iron-containing alcohol dehydrogenase [Desulfoplanes sp.]